MPLTIGLDAKRAALNRVGIGNYARTLIRDLCTVAPENRYIAYSPAAFDPELAGDLTGNPSLRLVTPGYRDPLRRHWWRFRTIPRLLVEDKVDLYHGLSHTLPHGRLSCASAVTMHDLIYLLRPGDYSWVDRINYDRSFRRAAERADVVFAVSETTREDLVRFFGLEPERIVVTWQSCSGRFRRPVDPADRERVRLRYRLPERFILGVGTVEPRKNMVRLVEAFSRVADALPDVELLLAGKPTPYSRRVAGAAGKAAGRIRLLGFVPEQDLPALYHGASVFALVPLMEGFGIPLLEAGSCGTLLLTSNRGSMKEVAGEGSAILVDPEEVASIAEGLLRAFRDEADVRRLKAALPAQVARFSPEAVIGRVLAGYAQALGRKLPQSPLAAMTGTGTGSGSGTTTSGLSAGAAAGAGSGMVRGVPSSSS